MNLISMIVFAVLVSAGTALIVAGLAGWAGRKFGIFGAGPAAAALSLAAGVLVAELANAWPAFPPVEVTDRLAGLIAAVLVLGLCDSIRPAPAWGRWENRLLVVLLSLALVLGPVLGPDWPTRRDLLRQAGLALALLAIWSSLEALARRCPIAVLGPALIVLIAGAGLALLLSGSLVLGLIGLGLAASLGAFWLLACVAPGLSLSLGAEASPSWSPSWPSC